ncbi:MAG: hypothetical protein L0Y44_14465 [Phycisphaerales bacterium]|nr:hypothetical protein [Phycisphaerales bacterium]MCI0676651.1 hypothetical protein [Phycisphaerales bacterium]
MSDNVTRTNLPVALLLVAGAGLAIPASLAQTRSEPPSGTSATPARQLLSRSVAPSTTRSGANRIKVARDSTSPDGGVAGANPACPNPTHHCCTSGAPGCADVACCNLICGLDPFCCTTSWDWSCVVEADSQCITQGQFVYPCPQPPPCDPPNPNEVCETATDGGILAPGGSVTFTGTALCGNPDCPIFIFPDGNLWTRIELPVDSDITVSYCGSVNSNDGGPWGTAWINVAEGCPCGGYTVTGSYNNSCPDGNIEITWQNLHAGEYYYPILIDAFDAVGDYNITMSAQPGTPVCPNDTHDCCTTGTPGCADQACCELVCVLNPFCCETFWGSDCVQLWSDNCTSSGGFVYPCPLPCPNDDHECDTTGPPGCSDANCCELVCSFDPFCCQTFWDRICVNEARASGCPCDVPA